MELFTTYQGWEYLLRWFHVLAGIVWIGILYYFNFVQTPFFGSDRGGQARGLMMRGLVPNAMWGFRWGAMATFLTGWFIILGRGFHLGVSWGGPYMTTILTGAAMGSLMWFNVWFIIWPAQRLGIASAEAVAAGGEADPAAAAAAPRAGRASRTNTLFSIPLLWAMTGAANVPGTYVVDSLGLYWAIALGLIILLEINALASSFPLQGMLGKVSSTLHLGFGLAIVLYILQHVL